MKSKSIELKNNIEKWLLNQGYPFEMSVAKVMSSAGFEVQQSDYYYDEELESYREIDIIAKIWKDTATVHYSVNYVIECKVCKSNPWIVFKEKMNTARKTPLDLMPGNKLGAQMAWLYRFNERVRSLPILCNQSSVGYALVESLRNPDKKDNSYAALMAISKALLSFSQHPEYTHSAGKKICEIFVPVIIIYGELFEAYLNNKNSISLSQVPSSSIYWSNPVCGNRSTMINIVTENDLATFSLNARKAAMTLFNLVIKEGKIEKKAKKVKLDIGPRPGASAPGKKASQVRQKR